MITRNSGGSCPLRLFALLFIIFLLAQTIAGCDSTSPPLSVTPTRQVSTPSPSLSTPALSSTLHGPTNFLLNVPLQFSDVSGSTKNGGGITAQLDANTIETGINQEFKHLLFVVDNHDNVKVYAPGSTSPITAQVADHADGSTLIDYTQQSNSEAGSFSLTHILTGIQAADLSRDEKSARLETSAGEPSF